jgi:hypothetical protein
MLGYSTQMGHAQIPCHPLPSTYRNSRPSGDRQVCIRHPRTALRIRQLCVELTSDMNGSAGSIVARPMENVLQSLKRDLGRRCDKRSVSQLSRSHSSRGRSLGLSRSRSCSGVADSARNKKHALQRISPLKCRGAEGTRAVPLQSDLAESEIRTRTLLRCF